ncbi:uncharacterized protein LOC133779727 [Humulus lupulus]|uniref:uncharacterized protein LOC133779727 n=1 Tax=Humulus lupulus TaxID=3486 RepID=UPI002B4115D0|nr:uncharacterized protein LOC133779727 [Humulus lupulus]
MQKNIPFIWDEACQNAFESIKRYLLHPPVLIAPILGKPLILYITALDRSLGALLAQNNEDGKEVALYYLSRTLHYLPSHTVTLVSKANPLRYILSKLVLSRQLAKWSMILSEFEINFVPQKAIKGQALADFLVAYPIPDNMELHEDLPDEEQKCEAGAGIVFVTPFGGLIPYSFHILAICTNNVAEYEALIIGIEIALEMQIQSLEKCSFDGMLLRCLSKEEASHALQETHAGTCGAHQAGPKLSAQFKRLSYYWPTMVQDAINFAKCCKLCQLHGDFIHQPPQPLHPSIFSWPFETWGMDGIGPFTPPSSKIHKYILTVTDYFSKWAKGVPLKEVRAEDVANFIRTHIIYRYEVP